MTHLRAILTKDFQRLSWSVFLFFLGMHFLAPIAPVYFQNQGFEGTELGLLLGTFLLVSIVLRPWVGRTSDAVSPKPLMLGGIILATLAPLGYWLLAPWPWLMWLVRIAHGASFALFYTAATSYVVRLVAPAYKAEAISYYSNAVKLAMAFSPGLALLVADWWGPMAAFQLTAGVTLLTLLVIMPLPYQPGSNPAPHQQSQQAVSTAPPSKSNLFGLHRGALPLSSIMLTQSIVFGALIPFIPMLADEKHLGLSGWFYAVYALSLISTRFITGSWSDELGRYTVLIPSMAAVTLSVLLLALAPNDVTFLLATALYGFAAGAVQPSIMALISERASHAEQGTAMATFAVFCDIGIALGNVVMATLGHIATYGLGLVVVSSITGIGLIAMIAEAFIHEPAILEVMARITGQSRQQLAWLRRPVIALRRRYR